MNKGKKQAISIFVLLLLYGSWIISAEAPELKNVMPNSWQKVERVTGEEEQRVIEENDANIKEIITSMYTNTKNSNWVMMDISDMNKLYTKAYKQQVGTDIFYRFFITDREIDTYDEWVQQHIQIVVWQKGESQITLGAAIYNSLEYRQNSKNLNYTSIDIIESGGTAKAVLISKVSVAVFDNSDDYRTRYITGYVAGESGQPAGEVYCYYFALNDYNNDINYFNDSLGYGYIIPDIPYITIEGSPCLVDVNSPLRYGLQSAFDGNPATSYVENTEDDLMGMLFVDYFQFSMEKIAVINGYAQNENLYKANNRIREITVENNPIVLGERSFPRRSSKTEEIMLLDDNELSYQYFSIKRFSYFFGINVYKGTKYNDTCLAELNIKTLEKGWLFGDIENE